MDKENSFILVAEDDEDHYLLIREAFEQSGLPHEIFRVKDGEELMEYLRKEGAYADFPGAKMPGVILLDLNMPKKDGRQALREIRANPETRKIPVIVLTMSRADTDIDLCYNLGANSYISKPLSFAQLIAFVKAFDDYWFQTVVLPHEKAPEKHESR